jgi:hypothetical protein
MKKYKVIKIPASKSVTGKDTYGIVPQSYNVGPDHIVMGEDLEKKHAEFIKQCIK